MKTSKDKYTAIGLIIIVTLVGFFAFSLRTTDNSSTPTIETVNYNGFIFEKLDNIWVSQMSVVDAFKGWNRTYIFEFHYTPNQVEYIETMKDSLNKSVTPNLLLNVNQIYITMDPEYPAMVVLGYVEISKIIRTIYEKSVTGAVNRPNNRTAAPVITCEDISPTVRVIELRLGNRTGIYNQRGCIIVEGRNETELLMASERLAFELLKIL